MWLCFALAVADIFLIFFMCPESNFRRPEWDLTSPSGLDTAEAEKKNGANDIFFENVPPEAGYTVRQPSLADMIVPIRVDRDLNFFQAMVAPLRGLTRPAVIWVVLLYGCALSPQIIFMSVSPSRCLSAI